MLIAGIIRRGQETEKKGPNVGTGIGKLLILSLYSPVARNELGLIHIGDLFICFRESD